jgi:hypothetical protein
LLGAKKCTRSGKQSAKGLGEQEEQGRRKLSETFLLVRAAPKLTKTQNKSPQFIIFGQKRLLHHFYHLRQTYISSRNLGRK